MANGQKKQSSGFSIEYLCCCGCIIGGIFLVFMMINFISGSGFEGGKNDESLQDISEETCKENCYDKYGDDVNETGYNGIACLAIGSNQYSPEIRAFVRAITNSESNGSFDSYYELYGSIFCPNNDYCSSFNRSNPIHPGVENTGLGSHNCHGDYCSDAFGRYQCLSTTWTGWAAQANIPLVKNGANNKGESYYDMSPKNQDVAVITELISRGTETKLKNNDIEGAIRQNNGTWTSLPGGSQLNSKTNEFRDIYYKLLAEEKKGCGQNSSQTTNVQVAPSGPNDFSIKDVRYLNQGAYTEYNINNMGCGQTSTTMVINYIANKNLTPPQFAAKWGYNLRGGLSTETGKTITDTDFDASNPSKSWKNIFDQVNKYNPVIIGTGFSTGLGHIMVILGYQKDNSGNVKYVYVHDPAGNHGTIFNGTYTSSNGAFAKYEINDFTYHLTAKKHQDGSFIYYVNNFSRSSNNTATTSAASTSTNTNDDLNNCLKKCEEQSQTNQGEDSNNYSDDCRLFPISTLKKDDLIAQITTGSGREFLAQREYSETCGTYRTHKGNDLLIPAGSSINYPVRAVESGTVSQIIDQFIDCGHGWTSYILIKNDNGLYNGYGEVDASSVNLKVGDKVTTGQQIAYINNQGCGMLHFERSKISPRDGCSDSSFEDPFPYLKNTTNTCQTIQSTSTTSNSSGNMPHYCQPDGSSCGPTSLLMTMQYYGLAQSYNENTWLQDFRQNVNSGSISVNDLLTQANRQTPKANNICWHTNLPKQEIINRAKNNQPTVVDTYFYHNYGQQYFGVTGGSSGHFVTVKGYEKTDNTEYLIINDPACWGGKKTENTKIPITDFFDSKNQSGDDAALYATPCQ